MVAVPVMATCWSKETAVRVDMGEYVPGGTEMRRKMPLPRYVRACLIACVKPNQARAESEWAVWLSDFTIGPV